MPDLKQKPYLSVVVTSRNDNHGGDLLKRMRIFVTGLIHQCSTHRLFCELIVVDWNPVSGQPLLNSALPSPDQNDYLVIRYIQVPASIHETLAFSKQIPLFQMIAKNVGIRRAKAEFVLCTNVDLLFTDELFKRLAKKDLSEHCFYRANRCDVPNTLNENWPVEQQLEFCKNNIVKRFGKHHLYYRFKSDSGFMFKYNIFKPLLNLLATLKGAGTASAAERFGQLDLDACGDFTLMSKQSWINMQGYPELEMDALHIDSMAVIAAAALGMQQVIFKEEECTYHMQHADGWGYKTPLEKIKFYSKKPVFDYWAVREAGIEAITKKQTFNLNTSNWGMADVILQEDIYGN